MIIQIPDVVCEIQGEIIQLQQSAGSEGIYNISLHRIHFDHIASKLGIPSLTISAQMIRRRLEIIEARINALASANHYRTEIIDSCGSGIEFITELDAVSELASEFLKDTDIPNDTKTTNIKN